MSGRRFEVRSSRVVIVFDRLLQLSALLTMVMISTAGCRSDQRSKSAATTQRGSETRIHYLEIVTNDADAVTVLYEGMYGLSFGPPEPDLAQARVATRADGTLVGIRKPAAAHEHPIVRTYVEVADIQQAVKKAEERGAKIPYPPTQQGRWGTFAIVWHGDVQHGLWQR